MAFISADYTLLAPATGRDILNDVQDLFRFLELEVNQRIREACMADGSPSFEIDTSALAVAGSSAGSMCVYYAALYASPKPKVALSLYGMGGDMLVSLMFIRFGDHILIMSRPGCTLRIRPPLSCEDARSWTLKPSLSSSILHASRPPSSTILLWLIIRLHTTYPTFPLILECFSVDSTCRLAPT